MSRAAQNQLDRRVARTRKLIFDAFFALVQKHRFDEIKTQVIVEAAGIGKSTFYEHFSDKNDLLQKSLEGPFLVLARSGNDLEGATSVLTHFWERRALARIILSGPTRSVAVACMTQVVMGEFPISSRQDHAITISRASGFVALLAEWVTGKLALDAESLAQVIAQEMESLRRPG